MQTLIAGGQLGDVVHNFTGDSSFQLFFASGVTIPLDKFIADDKYDLKQFYPFTIEITKLDGKVGGLPFKGHPSRVGIFYNRTVLEAAGAKIPTNDSTYDDLIEAAKKAHKAEAQRRQPTAGRTRHRLRVVHPDVALRRLEGRLLQGRHEVPASTTRRSSGAGPGHTTCSTSTRSA